MLDSLKYTIDRIVIAFSKDHHFDHVIRVSINHAIFAHCKTMILTVFQTLRIVRQRALTSG